MLIYQKRIEESKFRPVWILVNTRALFLLLLICVPLTFALLPPTNAQQPAIVVVDAERRVQLQEFGLIQINDTLTVTNPGSDPAFYVLAAFPQSISDRVQFFQAETADGAVLLSQRFPLINPNSTGWQIFVPEPILTGSNFTYKTAMVLEGQTDITPASVFVEFSPIPTSPYFIHQYNTTFRAPPGFGEPAQSEWSGTNVTAYTYEPTTLSLSTGPGSEPLLTYLELKRQLFFEQWGYLRIRETHTFRIDSVNPLEWAWQFVRTPLPRGAEFLLSWDSLTNLSETRVEIPTNLTHTGVLVVMFPYVLREGDVYQFFLEYRCPLDIYQTALQDGLSLEFELYYGHPWIIRHQISEFILPEGSILLGASQGSETTTSSNGQYVIRYHEYNVTTLHRSVVSLQYVYPLQPAFIRPSLIFMIFAIIGFVYLVWRRTPFFHEEEQIVTAPISIDPTILGEFCALYGEKVALLLQAERLEKNLLAGKLSKPRYRKERKNFERKLRALENVLQGRTRPLIEAGGKYESSCQQLEFLDAERLSAIEALRALEQRYRQKRITANVYQKLRSDLEKRRDKAVSRMDRILLDLREEVNL